MGDNRWTRRTFLQALVLGGAGLISACSMMPRQFRLNKPVLKYPENADEIADFWDIFAEPGFNAEAAVKGLNITGQPEDLEQGGESVTSTYPKQNDLVSRVRIDQRNGEIDEMYLNYENPISVSLGRLEYLFGEPKNLGGPVGFLSMLDVSVPVANRGPNPISRGPYYMQFGFDTRHTLPDGRLIKGRVGVSADGDYSLNVGSKTRNVNSIEFTKFRSA